MLSSSTRARLERELRLADEVLNFLDSETCFLQTRLSSTQKKQERIGKLRRRIAQDLVAASSLSEAEMELRDLVEEWPKLIDLREGHCCTCIPDDQGRCTCERS